MDIRVYLDSAVQMIMAICAVVTLLMALKKISIMQA
jgi:hypothetical protein